MLAMKLVRLIEKHSEALSRELMEQVLKSELTSDFQKIPQEDLRLAATDLYRNLGEWLLQKRECDIANRFKAVAAERVAEGIRPQQMVWALMLTRDHLWRFLREEAFADSILQLHAELELLQLLNQSRPGYLLRHSGLRGSRGTPEAQDGLAQGARAGRVHWADGGPRPTSSDL